jgi:hypothetical protein
MKTALNCAAKILIAAIFVLSMSVATMANVLVEAEHGCFTISANRMELGSQDEIYEQFMALAIARGVDAEYLSRFEPSGVSEFTTETYFIVHASSPAIIDVFALGLGWWGNLDAINWDGNDLNNDEGEAEGRLILSAPGTYFVRIFNVFGNTQNICVIVDGQIPTTLPAPITPELPPIQTPELPPMQTPVAPIAPLAPAANSVSVTINGIPQIFDVPPQIIDGRTMLPLRAIGEAMGMTVNFDVATNTATLTDSTGLNISHVINTNVFNVNGSALSFDVPSTIVDGRTLVPVRMIAEATGADVDWDNATRTAKITRN